MPDTDRQETALDPRWPVVRRPTARVVWLWRGAAVVLLGYGLTMLLLVLDNLDVTVWLWVAIVAGGLVHLAGVAGLWFLAPRLPSWPRSGRTGNPAERAQAVKALRAGADLDDDQRRSAAGSVAEAARTPLVVAAAFALLGPVLLGTPNTESGLPWLGYATAAVVLVVLAGAVLQVRATRRTHRAALRADALPAFDGRDAPYLP